MEENAVGIDYPIVVDPSLEPHLQQGAEETD